MENHEKVHPIYDRSGLYFYQSYSIKVCHKQYILLAVVVSPCLYHIPHSFVRLFIWAVFVVYCGLYIVFQTLWVHYERRADL